MTLALDPGTFGGTKACHILIEKLNATDDVNFAASVIRLITKYNTRLHDASRVKYRTRLPIFKWLRDDTWNFAIQNLEERFIKYDIPISYLQNIIYHRYHQAKEHAAIIDKLSDDEETDRDFKQVLNKLMEIDRKREYDKL